MKKLAALLLALMLAAVCCVCIAEENTSAEDAVPPEAGETAEDEDVPEGDAEAAEIPDGITEGDWVLKALGDGTAEILRYTGSEKEIAIPAELNGMPVSAIGSQAFLKCRLQSVTIPDSVVRIGDCAFDGCARLQRVSIPAGVSEIGVNPFVLCVRLAEIAVAPDNPCFEVRNGALCEKESGRLICYPCGSAETDYTIPDGVLVIGESAFRRCENLISVSIPAEVVRIDPGAFSECVLLASAALPDGIAEIADRAFSGCESLLSADIPDSVTRIGNWAYFGCLALPELRIPDSVADIGYYAFSHCPALAAVSFPDSVVRIGACAFAYCKALKEVRIPETVTEIGYDAFDHCSEELTVSVAEGSFAEEYCRNARIPFENE